MAQPANNNNDALIDENENMQIVANALQDFGIPIGRALQIARSYAKSADYLMDVRLFLDNYKRFEQLQNVASSLDINLVEDLAKDELQNLIKKLNNNSVNWKWEYLAGTLPNGDDLSCASSPELEQKKQLESQIKQLEEFKKKWNNIFTSKEAMQAKADEILQRNKWLKIVELAMVFKDVCIGINRVKQISKKIQLHKQELIRINNDYVQPTMRSVEQNGTIDDKIVQTALMQLRYIKTQCEVEQKDSAKSWFGHLANAVSMGFQAYSSCTNASALANIASKAIVNQTMLIGAVQGTLSVGSFILSGIEAYNYIQYKNIIDDVKTVINKLEYYNNKVKRLQ